MSTSAPARPVSPQSGLDGFFRITERGSTVGREIRGGLATFFTMAYIVVLNPIIIGTQADSTGAFLGGGDPQRAMLLVAAATALVDLAGGSPGATEVIPQPLAYLITDTARRHGLIRVGATATYLRSDDPVGLVVARRQPAEDPAVRSGSSTS